MTTYSHKNQNPVHTGYNKRSNYVSIEDVAAPGFDTQAKSSELPHKSEQPSRTLPTVELSKSDETCARNAYDSETGWGWGLVVAIPHVRPAILKRLIQPRVRVEVHAARSLSNRRRYLRECSRLHALQNRRPVFAARFTRMPVFSGVHS